MKDKVLSIRLWIYPGPDPYHVRNGYTRSTDDYISTFRLGPVVIGWEVEET